MNMTKKLKVLVTGSLGLVGSHFVHKNPNFDFLTPSSKEFDLLDSATIESYLKQHKPDWIVNFAAYTDVSKAELQKDDKEGAAWQINVEGVKRILDAFKSKNIIQISTDMVFPGNAAIPGPYTEEDTPPDTEKDLTWYGWTKNRAEKLVRQRGGTILRIIYPVTFEFDKRPDYIRGPVKRFVSGKMYPLFNDQQISITYIKEITEVLNQIINKDLKGVYHVSSNTTTPFELIKKTLENLGEDTSGLQSSSVVEFLKTQKNPARYPVSGGLNAKATENKLGMRFSSWNEILTKMPSKSSGPREYKTLKIANAVTITPAKYLSEPDGFVMETADFTELGYFLGYKFEPRSMYAIWSPEGIGRGGHKESRSKLVTVMAGAVYYCLIDMRPGDNMGKICEFYLGDHEKSVGRSVLVPEGVVDYWIPVRGFALTHNVGDRQYNKFDNKITLNMKDPEIGLHIPEDTLHSIPIDEESKTLSYEEFIEYIKK